MALVLGIGIGLQCLEVSAHAAEAQSQWVHFDDSGKLVYKTTAAGDRVMDFSHAGFMGGGVAIPVVPVRRTVRPSADEDQSAGIQAAMDAVSTLPPDEHGFRGAVLLAPGTYPCSRTITISASGVVLRGSGCAGAEHSTIRMTGRPHLAIAVRIGAGRRQRDATEQGIQTSIADPYVPSGASSFTVSDAAGFAAGDTIAIRRPVTDAWIKFMGMHDLVRDGQAQTWLRAGTVLTTERRISAVTGRTITVDVPLSDSFDQEYLDPPGTIVAKTRPSARVTKVGIESLRIESPPQAIPHTQPHFTAVRLDGEDCWMRDVLAEETMNSIALGGQRITLQRVTVYRKALHQGSSRPAEFAPNAGQVLMDRCSATADNVWFVGTGARVSGPIVLLNCTFRGNSKAESHQRWSTGLLYDNCQVPDGGIELRNRGSMGSGHGWSIGWGVVWNCDAKEYIVQNPPGAVNWLIGSKGPRKQAARPFGSAPNLPEGIVDAHGTPVAPRSLYLAQLAERLGPAAVKNLGY